MSGEPRWVIDRCLSLLQEQMGLNAYRQMPTEKIWESGLVNSIAAQHFRNSCKLSLEQGAACLLPQVQAAWLLWQRTNEARALETLPESLCKVQTDQGAGTKRTHLSHACIYISDVTPLLSDMLRH